MRLRRRAAGLTLGAVILFVIGTNAQAGWLFVLAALLLGTVVAGIAVPLLGAPGARRRARGAGRDAARGRDPGRPHAREPRPCRALGCGGPRRAPRWRDRLRRDDPAGGACVGRDGAGRASPRRGAHRVGRAPFGGAVRRRRTPPPPPGGRDHAGAAACDPARRPAVRRPRVLTRGRDRDRAETRAGAGVPGGARVPAGRSDPPGALAAHRPARGARRPRPRGASGAASGALDRHERGRGRARRGMFGGGVDRDGGDRDGSRCPAGRRDRDGHDARIASRCAGAASLARARCRRATCRPRPRSDGSAAMRRAASAR